MKRKGKAQFNDADVQAMADGTGEFADATPEEKAAAQAFLANKGWRTAADAYGQNGGAKMDGAIDGSYWTKTFETDQSIDAVVGTSKNIAGSGSFAVGQNGETTLGGADLEQALGRETQAQTDARRNRENRLNAVLNIPGIATPNADGQQGFTTAQLKEMARTGTFKGQTLTPAQRAAVDAVAQDETLMNVLDELDTTGPNSANADGWINAATLQAHMMYALRYAAAADANPYA
jgi:hypothetical protein